MKHKLYIKFCLILSIFISFSVFAYSQGGSNYSIFGYGDFNSAISSGYEGAGGTAIAIPDRSIINFTNPALLSFVGSTRLQVGYRFNQNVISDANSTIWQNNGGINAISIVFAFDTARKIAGSFGLIPLTKVNYMMSKEFSQPFNGTEIKGTTLYKGSGGLSAFYGTLAGKIFGDLYLGGTIYGNFGSIRYFNEMSYQNDYAYSTHFIQNDFLTGIGYKLGLFYELPMNLSVGAYFQDYGKFSIEREKSFGSALVIDSTMSSKFEANSPKSLGFGASWKTGKFLIGADYKILDVSNLDYGYSVNNKFNNSNMFSLGIVREGNPRRNAPMLDRSSLRFGFAFGNLYYEIANQKINEMKFTIGAGVPFASNGILDTSIIFGSRGTTGNGLVREYFGRMVIDISIGEGWFNPFKREY